jgi:hypothetical protein
MLQMSKWLMWGHFRHLNFNSFPMTWKTPQGEVFWPLELNSEVLGVSEDSQVPISGVWVLSSHSSKSGVVTFQLEIRTNSHTAYEIAFIILICQVCGPWIVSKKLSQEFYKLQAKHFLSCPIYLVILQVVKKCPIPNSCLEFYMYIL